MDERAFTPATRAAEHLARGRAVAGGSLVLSRSLLASVGVHVAAFGGAAWLTLAAVQSSSVDGVVISASWADDAPPARPAEPSEPARELEVAELAPPQLVEHAFADSLEHDAFVPRGLPAPDSSREIARLLRVTWTVPAELAPPPVEPPVAVAIATPPRVPLEIAATPLETPAPAYPPLSRRNDEEGSVLVCIRIASDGRVAGVDVTRSSGFTRLDAAARASIAGWRFAPATRDGSPIESSIVHEVTFRLHAAN